MTQHPQALTCLVELLLFLFHRKFFCEKGLTDPSFWDKILVESVPWFALGVLLGACSPDGVARVPFLCQNSLAVYRRHRARNSIKKTGSLPVLFYISFCVPLKVDALFVGHFDGDAQFSLLSFAEEGDARLAIDGAAAARDALDAAAEGTER